MLLSPDLKELEPLPIPTLYIVILRPHHHLLDCCNACLSPGRQAPVIMSFGCSQFSAGLGFPHLFKDLVYMSALSKGKKHDKERPRYLQHFVARTLRIYTSGFEPLLI
jgi:hypothetical protein